MPLTLEDLIARLSAGEPLDLAKIPTALREQPEVQRLLQLSRVLGQLDVNAGTDLAAQAKAEQAPSRLGPFRLERRLGVGGMGEVWLGRRDDGQAEQTVAVKRVRADVPGFAERLRSERRILARLEHPNIARFIDAGIDEQGSPWLALEFVDGAPVTDWCQQNALGLNDRLRLFQKICAAVDHAHRQLVVHRDLKPANVLVGSNGEPKLLDFGIAKLLDDSQVEATSSSLTPAYAAPEQLRGGTISTAADIYALGLLLFRLLAGQLPPSRRAGQLAAMLDQLDTESSQRPSSQTLAELPYSGPLLRGDLDAIVSQALRVKPTERYRSALELSDDIERHLQSRPVRARAPTRRYRLGRFLRRNAVAVVFGAIAALALIVGSAMALDQARSARSAATAALAEAARADQEASAARAQAARAKRYGAFVLSVFAQADVLKRDGRGVISIDEAFEDSLSRIDQEFSDDAMVAADLNDDFGELLASKGRFDEAQSRFEKALHLAESAHGMDSLEAAESLLNLAVLSGYRGKPLDGKAWIERAVDILATHPAADPVLLGNARMALGSVLMQANQGDAARGEVREGLRLYRENLQANDQRMSSAIFNAGAMEHAQGNFAEAQHYLDEAIGLVERVQGAQSAALLPILDFSMTNLDRLARHDEAEAAALRLRDIADATYPNAHPLRASARMELGYHQMHSGQLDAGRAELADGIAMSMALDSSLELLGWNLLIKALRDAEQWSAVLSVNADAQKRCRHYADADTRRCQEIAAYALEATAVSDRSEATLRQIEAQLDANQTAPKPSSIVNIALLGAKARAQQTLGRNDAAKRSLDDQIAALKERFPEQHRDLQAAMAWRQAVIEAPAD